MSVFEIVSSVKSVGPMPMIPSTPSKSSDVEATPMDCFVMTSEEESVTVSRNSVPEKEPLPYVTETLLPVSTLEEVFT